MYFRVMLSVLGVLMCAGIVHAAPFAYIANNTDNTVSVLDTASNQVTAVINVGQGPFGVAVNGMGGRVYVSNQNDNTISVIDTTDNSVTSIPVTVQPGALAVNSAGTRLFVANPGDNSVSVINTVSKTLVTTVPMAASCQPEGVAVGPADINGDYDAYVSCYGSAAVAVIDANDAGAYAKKGTDVVVPAGPRGISVSADGKKVYVAGMNSSTLTVIDALTLATPAPGDSLSVGVMPYGVAVDPTVANSANPTKIYVTNWGGDSVSVVNSVNGAMTLSDTKGVGSAPRGVAFAGDGLKAVTSNYLSSPGDVSVILAADNSVTTTTGGTAPLAIGNYPSSFGNFAGPSFVNITATVPDHTCGEITTSELITPTGTPASYIYRTAKGKDITFAITAKENCTPASVLVDSGSIGTPASYTFDAPVANHTLEANFTRNAYKIVVTKSGNGTGIIETKKFVSNQWVADDVIDCGSTCSGSDAVGATVALFATPSADSELFGWSGSGCSGVNICLFTLDQLTANTHASNGVFYINAEYRVKASGPIRASRPNAPQYKIVLQDAYNSLSAGSVVNPIDLNASTEFTLIADQFINLVLIGGWTEWATNGWGSIPAGSASTITGPLTVKYGSVTIGSCDSATNPACVGSGGIIVK